MPDKEGTLQMQPSGRWAVCRPGRSPVAIRPGDLFRVAVAGKEGLQPTRMEFRHFTGPMNGRTLRGQPGEYYSVDDYRLANGMRAALPLTSSIRFNTPVSPLIRAAGSVPRGYR
jgi:hypothetical protein